MAWRGRDLSDAGNVSALDAATHAWVRATGRAFDARAVAWLDDPPGLTRDVGGSAVAEAARWGGFATSRPPGAGLVERFDDLAGGDFDAAAVAPAVRDFYEQTSRFELRILAEPARLAAWPARAIVRLFSRRLGQLDLPMNPSTEPAAMRSEVVHLRDDAGRLRYAGWVRHLADESTERTVYAGFYGHVTPPAEQRPCVKVAFPLPRGTATVLLSPHNLPGGGLRLVSAGETFGGSGFYFTLRKPGDARRLWVRFVPQMHETIEVRPTGKGEAAAVHDLWFGPVRWLRLRYAMRGKA